MFHSRVLLACVAIVAAAVSCNSYSLSSSKLFGSRPLCHERSAQQSFSSLKLSSTSSEENAQQTPADLKKTLLERLATLRQLQKEDGDISIDFGVKGGELDKKERRPQKVDFYGTSERVGKAADDILELCESLSALNPTDEPTQYLGDRENGINAPLNGEWKQLFTTAADATFSSNSTRGDASVKNVVDASKNKITNMIDFSTLPDGTEPVLKQLHVVIRATAEDKKRVGLQFRYAKAVLTKFFFFPLFGRKLTLYIPVPAAFITRIIVFFSRIIRMGRKGVKKVPKGYFDVLYLDKDLRIHRTGEDNLFVQASSEWDAAQPYVKAA